ncbi:MAG: GNAT family N-acetyltransferase [Alphaproteobacteria bacterium]|nr:GNAT family N-acetyltransferase [Alphaproteobacteria bacterium]
MKVEPVVLSNDFVRLEPLLPTHREPLRVVAADPELWRFHAQNHHGATFDAWFDLSLRLLDTGEGICFVVIDAASGEIAGSSSYLAVVPAHKRLEIGSTWYPKPFQGGSTNPATKLALMSHAFEALAFNRVEFKLDSRNAQSWAAMRKLGATQEGIFRRHLVLPDGYKRDSVYFSVIAEEWPSVKAGIAARLSSFKG